MTRVLATPSQRPVDEPEAVGGDDDVRWLHGRAAASPRLSHVYGPVRAEQDRIRRDHRAAQRRRLARQRARRRCEDLTELLGRMTLLARHRDEAADLLRRSLVAAREIEGLVTGAHAASSRQVRRRQRITADALNELGEIVDLLDEAIRDSFDEEADAAGARRLAVELATTLALGVEAIAAPAARR